MESGRTNSRVSSRIPPPHLMSKRKLLFILRLPKPLVIKIYSILKIFVKTEKKYTMLLSSIFPYWAYVCSLTQGLAHVGTREPKPRIWAYPMANRLMDSSQLGNKQWRKSKRRQNHKVEIRSALTSHTPPPLTNHFPPLYHIDVTTQKEESSRT